MNRNQFAKDYLTFTRKERIGLLALVFAIILVMLLPKAIRNTRSNNYPTADTSWITAMRKLEVKSLENERDNFKREPAENEYAYHFERTVNKSAQAPVLFHFDPNTLDEGGWLKLGLKNKTIHTIQNFVSKGGHFYKPEDLKRIYGLHPDEFERLEPYIKIEGSIAHNNPIETTKPETTKNSLSYKAIDINQADTVAFISLPGIGAKLATRIVNFREKLGGFYSIAQVAEVYGIPDSTFQKIKQYLKIESNPVKKININTASVDELKAHPYIRSGIAGPIVAYRNEHGPFSRLEDIKKVLAVTDNVYDKIFHYLSL